MASMKPEGSILEIDLLHEISRLAAEGFSGALRFEKSDSIRILYFQNGDLLSASTNEPNDSIESILLEAERVSREHVDQAISSIANQESLGETLLNLGFISKKELRWARRTQLVRVLNGVVGWDHGSYAMVPDYVPSRSEGTIYPTGQIILESILAQENRQRFEESTGVSDRVFSLAEHFDDRYKLLGLNEDADRVIALVDGSRSAAEISSEAPGDPFLSLKLLYGLHLLGLIEVPSSESFEQQPLFGADSTSEARSEPEREESPATAGILPSVNPPGPGSAPDPTEPDPSGPEPLDFDEPLQFDDPADLHSLDPDGAASEELPLRSLDSDEEDPLDPIQVVEEDRREPSRARALTILPIALIGAALIAVVLGWRFFTGGGEVPENPVPVAVERGEDHDTRDALSDGPPTAPNPVAEEESRSQSVPASGVEEPSEDPPAPTEPEANEPQRGRESARIPTSADDLRARYDQMAADSRGALSEVAWTVQFEIVCETASVTLARDVGGDRVWFIPISFRGRDCFRVFWGRYDSAEAARAAIPEIPERLRDGGRPVVIDVQQVFF